MVTPAQLKKHLVEAARKQSIAAMGGDPTTSEAPMLKIRPITGNDIFPPQDPAPTHIPTVNDDVPNPEVSVSSPSPAATLPHPIPSHLIDDNDFTPDTIDHPHDPPNIPKPLQYPSIEIFDEGEDDTETEDQDDSGGSQGAVQDVPHLEEFMDWEYLTQRTFNSLLECIALALRFRMTAGNLTQYEHAICRMFAFLVRTQLTNEQFSMIPETWPEISDFHSEHILRAKASGLAGIEPIRFDCCVGSCVCFAGHYTSLEKCPRCNEPRFEVDSHGKQKPRSQFFYIPLIPRLIAYLKSPHMASTMQYRSQRQHIPGSFKDIFDGTNYQALRSAPVTVHGEPINPPTNYFQDPRDVALGLSLGARGHLPSRPMVSSL